MPLDKYGIAKRIAQELSDGMYVNLGIGIPTLVSNYIPKGMDIILQSENGILGMGPYPTEEDIVAAAKNIIVAMMHTNPKGESKLLPKCTLPLTGVKCVKRIVTEIAVLDVTPQGFKL